jgi:hypothetical protein
MDNWNDVWQKNTEKGDDPCLINGFEHCENNINSYELFKHIIQVNNIDKFEKILHFGCGSGRLGKYFIDEDYNYCGVDKSLNMINKFKTLLNYENVYTINSNKLPFEDNSFDIVFCYSVMQYLNSLDDFKFVLNEFIRVSKRMIYIGDLESIDHSLNNKKYYKYNSTLKHLIINKKYIPDLNLKYKINMDTLCCTRNSRYNCIINKNDYVFGKKVITSFFDSKIINDCKKELNKLINEEDKFDYIWKYYEPDISCNLSRIEYFVNNNKFFNELSKNKYILNEVNKLMGEESLLFKDKINLKYPNSHGFGTHQDSAALWNKYSNKIITIGITLYDLNTDNGCLYFSNKLEKQVTKNLKSLDGLNLNYKPELLKSGDLLLFDCFIPHMSYSNKSKLYSPVIYFSYIPKSEGDFYQIYHYDKFKNNPPDIYKETDKEYPSNNVFV